MQGSYKQLAAVLKRQTRSPQRGPLSPWLSQICIATLSFFLFPLKHNRADDTFLACRNCRPDRTRTYLDDTVVTVVNCCQLVDATRFFFMFPYLVTNTTLATVTTRSRQLYDYDHTETRFYVAWWKFGRSLTFQTFYSNILFSSCFDDWDETICRLTYEWGCSITPPPPPLALATLLKRI